MSLHTVIYIVIILWPEIFWFSSPVSLRHCVSAELRKTTHVQAVMGKIKSQFDSIAI